MTISKALPLLKGMSRIFSSASQVSFWRLLKTTLSQPSKRGLKWRGMSLDSDGPHSRLIKNLIETGSHDLGKPKIRHNFFHWGHTKKIGSKGWRVGERANLILNLWNVKKKKSICFNNGLRSYRVRGKKSKCESCYWGIKKRNNLNNA